ncbi:hypothetical protein BC830DRAFT_1139768 [Chytriomyces sp. MP71]|nr:hypothetical protein BC830DRAFT_1139768 [Chytriomyces sp. MP71]
MQSKVLKTLPCEVKPTIKETTNKTKHKRHTYSSEGIQGTSATSKGAKSDINQMLIDRIMRSKADSVLIFETSD